ncbi:cyclic GMP-AMP synthase-like receptor [Tenebrio molitor]|uniref:cyclic GMP-AMP synthase-like receptor n=1 Tax=Tenebrio molitor TaxID=7067 RepID=UPI0036248A9C
MESILHEVNSRFISVSKEERRRNNKILKSVVKVLVKENMVSVDRVFKSMFRRVFYGGSYFDGLHVSRNYDYDLDLLLVMPKAASPDLQQSEFPSHIQLQVNDASWLRTSPVYSKFKKTFLDDDNYLITDKALRWMKGIVQKAFNRLPSVGGRHYLLTNVGEFPIYFRESGPAVTLHIDVDGDYRIDVDLVISFVFTENKWPEGVSPNPYAKWLGRRTHLNEFFIVAKKPKNVPDYFLPKRHWRLSFQEQERQLILQKWRLKPVGRLLKKMKKRQQHNQIASYYIKTVLLFMVEQRNDAFWKQSLSIVFLDTLETYTKYIRNKKIPYYWNEEYNLIGHIDPSTLANFADRLEYIINNIKRNPNQPDTVVEYLLNARELEEFYDEDW